MFGDMKTKKKKYYLAAIAVCLLAIIGVFIYYFVGSFSNSEKTEYVYIYDSYNLDDVSKQLSPFASSQALTAFRIMARHAGYADHIRSGRYAIPESRTTDRLAGALSKKLMLDSAAVAILLKDSAFCAKQGFDPDNIVCLFVPNTYEVYWNTSLDKLMARMKKEHDHFWNKERTDKAQAIGLTPNEVCTLASIIDEETANNQEKPMIAGMYLNRLKTGMPLQADPTIKFALQDFALRRIYHDMLTYDSPYNTYRNIGLPPGPIKIASVKGIDAVLNRVDHDYLYMCAKEDFSGTHNFAKTYQEHLKNAAKYSKALNDRGIK